MFGGCGKMPGDNDFFLAVNCDGPAIIFGGAAGALDPGDMGLRGEDWCATKEN